MVATSNMISCSQSNISCMTDSVQLCHILVAEFTPWHTSLGRKLIPPSSMPTCAALHQKAAYRSNPSRPSLIWNLLWLAIVAFMRCFPPCYFPAFFQFSSLQIWNIRIPSVDSIAWIFSLFVKQHWWNVKQPVSAWQASGSRLNKDYIW
jgi:hypothetical protein